MTELRVLRSLAAKVEKILTTQRRDVLAERARRFRGSAVTLQPSTREVIDLIDALAKARQARAREKARAAR